ncbi:MAG: KilA-N domain-containing protein [Lachnospira sp.]
MGKLNIDGTEIQVLQIEEDGYISLTDMVRKIDNGPALIEKWLRNKNTIEFLGLWEEMYNEDFDINAYDEIMQEPGLNRFIMSVKQWVTRTNSKGIVAKAGRYGGTYAYKDIAFEFASWVSPQFKLYLIKEFERLKKEEQALFGITAKQWRDSHPDKKGNIRDYASITELICLSNMENINAVLIEDGLSQKERLIKLNKIAIHQMSILEEQTTTVLK